MSSPAINNYAFVTNLNATGASALPRILPATSRPLPTAPSAPPQTEKPSRCFYLALMVAPRGFEPLLPA